MSTPTCTLDDVSSRRGTVVVIDVLRAFTTAAVALDAGAGPYRLVSTVEEAHAARQADPRVRLLGEVDGLKAAGFDLSNSPTDLAGVVLDGVPVVHRSSSGTQGVVRAVNARRVLCASFAVAGATATALAQDEDVTFCITGRHTGRDGDEDAACADYIAALMDGGSVEPAPYLDRVSRSTAAGLFGTPGLPAEDVEFCRGLDRFGFAMMVKREGDAHLLERVVPTRRTP